MFFPTFNHRPHAMLSLNEEAIRWREAHPSILAKYEKNPLYTSPEICQQMIDEMHERLKVMWSYGGWQENRSTLWKDSYMEKEQRFTHLGVDFNVPAGTEVMAPRRMEIVWQDAGDDFDGGWG